jgi:hypothetical protein
MNEREWIEVDPAIYPQAWIINRRGQRVGLMPKEPEPPKR